MANNMEPIKGKIEIKVDTSNLQKIKEPKFVEETFKTEKGGTASVVKIVSEALTGLVDAYGKGQIRQGQGVSAKELVQMYNNNVSLHGEDVRKINR